MKNKRKKQEQLGMNPSTAAHRLVKDILWRFVEIGGYTCHQCGQPMCRETFSIEHKTPWLDSEDPKGLYFDLENIAFSHLSCNTGAARKERLPPEVKRQRKTEYARENYCPERRRQKYKKTGH